MTLHPLDDTYLACHQCHPDDYGQRAKVFAMVLHVTPQASDPTVRPPVATSTLPPMIVPPAPQAAADAMPVWGWLVAPAVAILAIGLGVLVWWRSHSS
jgi:hypothetical protein